MIVYAEFFRPDGEPFCGSDSVLILDGRNNLANMIETAKAQVDRLRNVQNIGGFEIRRGDRFRDSNPVLYRAHHTTTEPTK